MPARGAAADEQVRQLWTALATPAGSMEELADRMHSTVSQVAFLLYFLRHQPRERYGWTVPHVQRGNGYDRLYVRVTLDARGSADVNDPATMVALKQGVIGRLSFIASYAESGAWGDACVGPRFLDRWQREEYRLVGREMGFTAQRCRDLLDTIRGNGTEG